MIWTKICNLQDRAKNRFQKSLSQNGREEQKIKTLILCQIWTKFRTVSRKGGVKIGEKTARITKLTSLIAVCQNERNVVEVSIYIIAKLIIIIYITLIVNAYHGDNIRAKLFVILYIILFLSSLLSFYITKAEKSIFIHI